MSCHLVVPPQSLQCCLAPMRSLWSKENLFVSLLIQSSLRARCKHHKLKVSLDSKQYLKHNPGLNSMQTVGPSRTIAMLQDESMHPSNHRSTLQVVLPQLRVSDVGDVVERSPHDGLVLALSTGCGIRHHLGLRLGLPGWLRKARRLRHTSRQLGA